jgi:hypothetical protein
VGEGIVSIDAALGRLGNKSGVCTSSTRPVNPFEGQIIYESDTNRTLIYDNSAWLVIADNQVLSIDSTNERVGISTTTPSSPLHIKADSFDMLSLDRTDNANVDQQVILTPTYSGSGNTAFAIKIGGEIMRVTEAGNVGIGDTTPSYTLDVNGDINATGDLRIGGTAIGEWTTFTTVGTNCTISSQACRYTQVNGVVHAAYRVDVSSITGIVTFTLPVTASVVAPFTNLGGLGAGLIINGSTYYHISPYVSGSTTMRLYYVPNGSAATIVDNTTPVSEWDNFRVFITYQGA